MMSLQGLRSTKELVNDVRHQALDQAGAPADFKFKHHRPVDIEKIKTSKYYSGPIQRAQLANLTVSTPSCCL
jgi:hypothetical protein